MQKSEISEIQELLLRHSQMSALEICAFYWVPEGKSLEWYLGFFQSLEIHRGIRELFYPGMQTEAYDLLSEKVGLVLEKIATERLHSS